MDRTYIQEDIGESKPQNYTFEIAASGVAQRIITGATPAFEDDSVPSLEVLITMDSDQVAPIAIGGEDVSLANGILLYPPEAGVTPDAYHDNPRNLNEVWVVGTEGTVVRVGYYPGP